MMEARGFRQALRQLRQHKLRTLLTLLGMVFGVGAVIAMLSISEGGRQEALRMIDSMGLRNLIVEAVEFDPETLQEIRTQSVGLYAGDIEAIMTTLPMVESYAAAKKIKTWDVYSLEARANPEVLAVSADYFNLGNMQIDSGRVLTDRDNQTYAQVAVLGASAAESLFPDSPATGKLIKVNHLWLKVIGVLKKTEKGKKEFAGITLADDSSRIFIPLDTARKRLKINSLESPLDSLKLRLVEGADTASSALAVDYLLKKRHGASADYRMVVPAALLQQEEQTQKIFTVVMAAIAGISLLVGGIGIMNIMLATVLERTPEIGLLRAVGARKKDIRDQFLMESVTIAGIGALIGIVFGLLLAFAVQLFAAWPVAFSLFGIVVSVVICLLTGIVFGLYPAVQAAELDPIKALQRD
ncbi:MAG: ABC transporter permease [Xanthomonadales bacterium]|nr:ABC transporter permease [Xanthomonadales bacterium]